MSFIHIQKKNIKSWQNRNPFFFLTAQTLFCCCQKWLKKKKIQRGDEIDQLIFIHREIQIIDVVELVVIKGPEYLGKDMIQ